MKKHENAIKAILKKGSMPHGFYEDEAGTRYIVNGHVIIKLSGSKLDFVGELPKLYKCGWTDTLNRCIDEAKKGKFEINININDVKMWDKYGDKIAPYQFIVDKKYMGLSAFYLNKLYTLTDNNIITTTNFKSQVYIAGDDIECVLMPVTLVKGYNENNYNKFITELKGCYIQDEETKKEKAAKKVNKATGIIPTLQPNKNYNGFTMSFYGVDYFMLSDAKRITKGIITEFVKAYCKRNNYSDAVLNDMLNSKIQLDNIKARIEKATFILYTNADNSAFTYIDIKTKNAFNGCMYFECDNKLVLIDCVLPTSTETKEETTPDICADDMSATDPETTETKTSDIVKADICTATDKAATTDTNNRKKVLHGFYMTFKNRDIFVVTNEETKRRYIVQSFINEMINISNHLQNITEEKRNNILNDEEVLNETKKRITPATIEEIWTRQENHIRITSGNNNMIVNHSLNNFKTIIVDCFSANEGITPTQEKSLKFFSGISRLNNQLTETITQDIKADLQADNRQTETTNNAITTETTQADARQDARQTETTQDKPQKTSAPAISLFVVTDKPAPVKLYGANIPTLERIPTYTQRIISRFKPLKNNKGYNTRVNKNKVLKKAYNDFVGAVSCYNDKCAMGGGMVAVNSS